MIDCRYRSNESAARHSLPNLKLPHPSLAGIKKASFYIVQFFRHRRRILVKGILRQIHNTSKSIQESLTTHKKKKTLDKNDVTHLDALLITFATAPLFRRVQIRAISFRRRRKKARACANRRRSRPQRECPCTSSDRQREARRREGSSSNGKRTRQLLTQNTGK